MSRERDGDNRDSGRKAVYRAIYLLAVKCLSPIRITVWSSSKIFVFLVCIRSEFEWDAEELRDRASR